MLSGFSTYEEGVNVKMQHEIAVNKLGTKWAQVITHYNTGRDSNAKIAV